MHKVLNDKYISNYSDLLTILTIRQHASNSTLWKQCCLHALILASPFLFGTVRVQVWEGNRTCLGHMVSWRQGQIRTWPAPTPRPNVSLGTPAFWVPIQYWPFTLHMEIQPWKSNRSSENEAWKLWDVSCLAHKAWHFPEQCSSTPLSSCLPVEPCLWWARAMCPAGE